MESSRGGFVGPLSISVANKTRFRAGETIVGSINRAMHFVDSDATLTIKFWGRSKVKITKSNGQSTSTYRSRYTFWADRDPAVNLVIYRGPVHIPREATEPLSWPFALTIPTTLPHTVIHQERVEDSFLKVGDNQAVQLPGTYVFHHDGFWSTDFEAYVEYHLEATLRDSKGHTFEAKLPVCVDAPSSPIPITDFGLRSYRGHQMILAGHRLNPALAEAKLTFSQKAQQVFGSSKVPTLVFQVTALTPSVLQLENPNIIPFQVKGSVVKERTSEVLRDLNHSICITKFTLKLKANMEAIAPGTFSNHQESDDESWKLVEYSAIVTPPVRATQASTTQSIADDKSFAGPGENTGKNELYAAPPPDVDTLLLPMDSAPFALDLGQALNIRLPGHIKHRIVTSTFTTFNIRNKHQLSWDMTLQAGGEQVIFSGKHDVTVMPRSEDATP
ncbi:hypothetical protein LIA77_06898 [Sarocladium implicatum]|nr:hypothetical protein LIA77_06898 [Sarocladium implicatum]